MPVPPLATTGSVGMGKYSKVAILFHWTIGLLIIANIALAQIADDLPRVARAAYMSPHKAIGILILVLSIGRIFWRLIHRPPALPRKITGLQAKAGHAAHILFYVLMIVMPVTGWLMVATHGKPAMIDFFGLFSVDMALGENAMLGDVGHEAHEILATPFMVLIGLHFLGALKHQFIDKLPFVQRMWP